MIKICDALMGSGKTQSSITYMNEHPHDKFIYITPYLEEASRIKKCCPRLRFVEPSNRLPEHKFSKTKHTAALVKEGKNITTTHQAFKNYTQDTLDSIKEQGYTLFIDEDVDILEVFDFHPDDIQMAVRAGVCKEENGVYSIGDKEYNGEVFAPLLKMLRSRKLIKLPDENNNVLFYWILPPELLLSFKDVFVLTYLFEGQSLHHFMKIYNLPYEYIGIEKTGEGQYRFGNYPGYIPEYAFRMKEMLHILDEPKMNEIGDNFHALSKNWYGRDEEENILKLKNNISNFFRNKNKDFPSDKRLVGSFNEAFQKIRGKGYAKSFLTFNSKSTNKYRDCNCLVYIANVFMNVNYKCFYESHGIEVDEDMFALSIMIQWIWRSAIRDGQEIYLYIPSRRMRTLLLEWIENVSKGVRKDG